MAIRSMTGFGSATGENEQIAVRIEVKALNGKFLEVSPRMPKMYQLKEAEVRKQVQQKLERGSIQVFINVELKKVNPGQYQINKELAQYYYDELSSLSFEMGAGFKDIMGQVLALPDVLTVAEQTDVPEENWLLISDLLDKSLDLLNTYRIDEGMAMGKAMETSVRNISGYLDEVIKLESARIQNIKERIKTNLLEFIGIENIDKLRFEQELVYFIERLDISEEKTRLQQHCRFFLENLYLDNNGKKLGFISQEMGREINTLGAKAYHFEIQQAVVGMKEELEKIKEQVLNIL